MTDEPPPSRDDAAGPRAKLDLVSEVASGRPRVSVIVPTHDTRVLTERCFAALAASPPPSCELILVDDASRDGTAESIVARHPEVRVLRLEGRQGFAAAANAGAAAARGELLWIVNSDTEVAPGAAVRMVEAFARDPALGIAGAQLCTATGEPSWSGGQQPDARWLFVLASGVAPHLGRLPGYRRVKHPGVPGGEADWVSGAAMMVRRTVWDAIGPFDERYAFYCQDVDLCLAARAACWRVAVVGDARVVHHEGGTIGRDAGAFGARVAPALLWSDLVRCAAKHGGAPAATSARRALVAGALLRVGARWLVTPLVPRPARDAFRRDTAALRAGISAVRGMRLGDPSPSAPR